MIDRATVVLHTPCRCAADPAKIMERIELATIDAPSGSWWVLRSCHPTLRFGNAESGFAAVGDGGFTGPIRFENGNLANI
jgi:hypothetical protein